MKHIASALLSLALIFAFAVVQANGEPPPQEPAQAETEDVDIGAAAGKPPDADKPRLADDMGDIGLGCAEGQSAEDK